MRSDNPQQKLLGTLEKRKSANAYAIADYKGHRVYLSGGDAKKMLDEETEVDYFDLRSLQWHSASKLNEGRRFHSSVCLGEHIYVFGGWMNPGTVESLYVGDNLPWSIIHEPSTITKRRSPAVAVINSYTIAVCGGYNGSYLNDGFVLDTQKNRISSILGSDVDIKFKCQSAV